MKKITLLLCFCFPFTVLAQKHVPAFEEVLSLRNPGTPVLSPNGEHVVYTVRRTDWKKNGYDTEIWIRKAGQEPFQLTNNPDGSSSNPQWSPDGKWVSFTSNRGNKNQIYIIRIAGGEAIPITHEEESVGDYSWAPNGEKIAFTRPEGNEKMEKEREKRYGVYEVDDQEYNLNWLYVVKVDLDAANPVDRPCYDTKDSTAQAWDCVEWPKAEALLDSVDFSIRNFSWSPDGKKIAFTHSGEDLWTPTWTSEVFFNRLWGEKELKILENAGHFPIEQPGISQLPEYSIMFIASNL